MGKGTRLWPPSSTVPRGRPRTRPQRKRKNSGRKVSFITTLFICHSNAYYASFSEAIEKFQARSVHEDIRAPTSGLTTSRTCGLCGSHQHDRRTCRAATIGDIFLNQISKSAQMEHMSLPLPPPDEDIDSILSCDEDCTSSSSASVRGAHQNIGRPVMKIFMDPVTRKRRPFSGVVHATFMMEGARKFKIKYDDGDTEDISSRELEQILIIDVD